MKSLLWIGFAGIVGVSGYLYASSKPAESNIHKHNAGNVQPGDEVVWKVPVRNNSKSLVKLTGFERACGINVSLEGNNVLLPGAEEMMTLHLNASTRRGPDAALFFLTRTSNGIDKEEIYEIDYNVLASPYLEVAECHVDKGSQSTVKVPYASIATPITVVSAPTGVEAKGQIQSVLVSVSADSPEGKLGDIVLRVPTENDKTAELTLPVFAATSQDKLRVYPESTIAKRTGQLMVATFKLLNVGDPTKVDISCANPEVKVTRTGDMITVSSTSRGVSGIVEVKVSQPDGQSSTAQVLF